MRITRRTRTRDILPLLYGSIAEEVLSRVPPVALRKPVVEMTVGEFCRVLSGEEEARLLTQRNAIKALGQLKELRMQMEQMDKLLQMYSTQPDPTEAMALGAVTAKPTAEETLLLEAAEAFGLDRLERRGRWRNPWRPAAEDVPLAELLVVRKSKAAAAQYRAALQRQAKIREAMR